MSLHHFWSYCEKKIINIQWVWISKLECRTSPQSLSGRNLELVILCLFLFLLLLSSAGMVISLDQLVLPSMTHSQQLERGGGRKCCLQACHICVYIRNALNEERGPIQESTKCLRCQTAKNKLHKMLTEVRTICWPEKWLHGGVDMCSRFWRRSVD